MEKTPVLTKEQAEALQGAKDFFLDEGTMQRNYILTEERIYNGEWMTDEFPSLLSVPSDVFIYALHYGYDVA